MLDPGGGGRSWPGLTVRSGEMTMDPEALNAAADALQSELESLAGQSPGSLPHLESKTTQTALFGNWDVARDMNTGYDTARNAVVDYYRRMAGELQNAISLLRETAGGTEGADEQSATAFGTQQASLDNSPPVQVREA